MKILCLYYDHWQDKNLNNIYNKGVHFKSNPRTFEYMESVILNNFKDKNIDIKKVKNILELDKLSLNDYEKIVLAYPDSIGLGWSNIEKYIQNNFNPMKSIIIINGRNRKILFNTNNIIALKIRRFLEKTLLIEIIFTMFFLVVTPFFLLKDLFYGKK